RCTKSVLRALPTLAIDAAAGAVGASEFQGEFNSYSALTDPPGEAYLEYVAACAAALLAKSVRRTAQVPLTGLLAAAPFRNVGLVYHWASHRLDSTSGKFQDIRWCHRQRTR